MRISKDDFTYLPSRRYNLKNPTTIVVVKTGGALIALRVTKPVKLELITDTG